MSAVTHINCDPNAEARIAKVVGGQLFAELHGLADSMARNVQIDFKDFETLRGFFDKTVFQVIEAIEGGRLYCEDQADDESSTDYTSLITLLIAALQVIYDGHFVETFAEEAQP